MTKKHWESLGNVVLAMLALMFVVAYAMDAAKRYDERLEKSAKLRGWQR